jgi:hypothetical protein
MIFAFGFSKKYDLSLSRTNQCEPAPIFEYSFLLSGENRRAGSVKIGRAGLTWQGVPARA